MLLSMNSKRMLLFFEQERGPERPWAANYIKNGGYILQEWIWAEKEINT
jgi:hypothetical protein